MSAHGESNMNNYGAINPNEVATLSLLGGGYGLGGHRRGDELLSAEAHANGTATAARVESTDKNVEIQGERMRDLLRDRQFNDISVALGSVREEMARIAGDNRAEISEVLREVQKGNCDLAKELLKCCCETQKEVISQGTQTRELINQRALDDAQRALDAADRQNQTNQLIAAFNDHHHHRRP